VPQGAPRQTKQRGGTEHQMPMQVAITCSLSAGRESSGRAGRQPSQP